MTKQVIQAVKVLLSIATVRSQILCQLTAKMICGLKSLAFADSGVRTVGMPQVWKGLQLGFEGKINCYGGKIFILLRYMFKANFSGHNKIGVLTLNVPMATGPA